MPLRSAAAVRKRFGKVVRQCDRPFIGASPAMAEARRRGQQTPDLLAVFIPEITADSLDTRFPGNAFSFDDLGLERREGIRDDGKSRSIAAHIVKIDSPMRRIAPLFDRAVTEQIQQQLRFIPVLMRKVKIKSFGNAECGARKMFLVTFVKCSE